MPSLTASLLSLLFDHVQGRLRGFESILVSTGIYGDYPKYRALSPNEVQLLGTAPPKLGLQPVHHRCKAEATSLCWL